MRHSWESVYCALVSVCCCHRHRVSRRDKSFTRGSARVTRQILTESPAGVSARFPGDRWKAARKAQWRRVARENSGAVRSFDEDGSVNTARRTDLYEGVADTIV